MVSNGDTSDEGPDRVRFRFELPAEPSGVPLLRHELTRWAQGLGIEDEVLGNVRLAVTEAVTNAVIHAYVGQPVDTVAVEARPGRDELVVRVTDRGRGLGPRADSPGLGMGLPLIGRLCTHVDLSQGPGGLGSEVRMTFAAAGLTGPASGEGSDTLEDIFAALARAGASDAFGGDDIGVLAELLVPRLADLCAVTLLDETGAGRRVGARVAHPDGSIDPEGSAWALRFPLTPNAPSAIAASTGITQTTRITDAWRREVCPDETWADELAALDLTWWAAIPLMTGATPVGAVTIAGRDRDMDGAVDAVSRVAEHAAGLVASARLVDDLRRTRRRLERILGALTEAVTVSAPEGRLVYANEAAVRLLGAADVDELLNETPAALAKRFRITDEHGRPVEFGALPSRRVLSGNPSEPMLTRSVHIATGRAYWLRTSATLLDDDGPLAVTVIQDVTAQTEGEHRNRFLADLGEALGSTLELDEMLRRLAVLTVPTLADWCVIDLVTEGGPVHRVALHHSDSELVRRGAELNQRHPPDLTRGEGIAKVVRENVPVHAEVITDEMLQEGAYDEEHLEALRAFGLRSAALLPMLARGRTLGVLTLLTAESGRTLTEADVAFAGDVARRVAMAVDNARLFAARDR